MVSHLPGSSGSDTSVDEKKRRRMISNRESARRSRMKKQKHLQDLISEMGKLEMERDEIVQACDAKIRSHLVLQAENGALVAEKTALTNYLQSINAIIGNFKEKGWLLRGSFKAREPWQFHCPSQHITNSNAVSYLEHALL